MPTQANGELSGKRVSAPNGAEKLDMSLHDADSEIEEVEVAPEETEKKEEAPDPQAELKARVSKLESDLEEERREKRKVSAMLTKEQQVRAEWERFHTATLPQINKSFEDRWAESPEVAVKTEVASKVDPMSRELAKTRAETWMTQIIVGNPELSKYSERVVELSIESPELANLTYSKSGIQKLFTMAKAEDVEKERDELRTKFNVTQEKKRTFTEEGSGRVPGAQQKARLTPAQIQIAQKLGIKPEDYLRRVDQVRTVGEVDVDG